MPYVANVVGYFIMLIMVLDGKNMLFVIDTTDTFLWRYPCFWDIGILVFKKKIIIASGNWDN